MKCPKCGVECREANISIGWCEEIGMKKTKKPMYCPECGEFYGC